MLKTQIIIVLLAFIAIASAATWFNSGTNADLPKCSGPRVRYSWETLSVAQRKRYLSVVLRMKSYMGAWKTGATTQSNLYDIFPQIHNTGANKLWHYTSAFIFCHRAFLWLHESAIQYVALKDGLNMNPKIEPADACKITIPYWPWEVDYDTNPKDSITPCIDTSAMWDSPSPGCDNCLGDSSVTPVSQYVDSGMFSNNATWPLSQKVGTAPYLDNRLKRKMNHAMLTVDATQIMNAIVTKPKFKDWATWCQMSGHNGAHAFLFYSMATNSSPDEPMFMLHHCNLDRLFEIWQECWGYSKISGTDIGDDQYCHINPCGDSAKTVYDDNAKTIVSQVPLNTEITFWWGSASTTTVILPKEQWPKIPDLWQIDQTPSWYDMNYRYGPDKIVQTMKLNKTICKAATWDTVDYGSAPSKKRSDVEDNETKVYREIQATLLRKIEEEGKSSHAAIHEMAMEACAVKTKPKMTPEYLAYLRMMGIPPSALDRICDEPSQDPTPRVAGRK